MGGSGNRFGTELPKQFTVVNGIPLYLRLLKKLSELDCITGIVAVVNGMYLENTLNEIHSCDFKKMISVVSGGATRSESVLNGLKALQDYAKDDDVVLMHDATHPYVDTDGTEKVIAAVREFGAATLASRIYDTAYIKDGMDFLSQVTPRADVVIGASPEGFRFKQILDIYLNTPKEDMEKMTSVGAIALASNITMKVIPTDLLNLKITHADDMEVFNILAEPYFKI